MAKKSPDQKSPEINYSNLPVNELAASRQNLHFFFLCLDSYRQKKHPAESKTSFVENILNDKIKRIGVEMYLYWVRGKFRKTDRVILPNFFLIGNLLTPLNLSLKELILYYAPEDN